jgi:Mycobacterial 4 TMS phage holin, superfamily IV
MLAVMTGVVGVLIKLGVRFVVFGLAFFIAAKKNPKIVLRNKWATPLIALVFALLNTLVYWALSPVLNLATLGAVGFLMPLVANLIFLVVTVKIFEKKKWIEIKSVMAYGWMALILTAVHGLCWLGLDYLPKHA